VFRRDGLLAAFCVRSTCRAADQHDQAAALFEWVDRSGGIVATLTSAGECCPRSPGFARSAVGYLTRPKRAGRSGLARSSLAGLLAPDTDWM